MTISPKIIRKHIDRRLIVQLTMSTILSLALIGVITYDVVTGRINLWLVGVGIIIGLLVGLFAGKMYAITWHEDDKKVISRINKSDIWIFAIYMVFSALRKRIAGIWIHGPALLAFTFTIAVGVMIGRLIFISLHIRKVLSKQGIN